MKFDYRIEGKKSIKNMDSSKLLWDGKYSRSISRSLLEVGSPTFLSLNFQASRRKKLLEVYEIGLMF